MTPLVLLRFVLMLAGLALFGVGIRIESDAFRWTGIGLLAGAVVIRLVVRLGAGRNR